MKTQHQTVTNTPGQFVEFSNAMFDPDRRVVLVFSNSAMEDIALTVRGRTSPSDPWTLVLDAVTSIDELPGGAWLYPSFPFYRVEQVYPATTGITTISLFT